MSKFSSAQAPVCIYAGGTGGTGQVTFWADSLTIGGDSGLFWNNATKNLGIGTVSPSQRLDVAGSINVSLSASCVYLPGGGKVCGNATCTQLYSPNGNTVMTICN